LNCLFFHVWEPSSVSLIFSCVFPRSVYFRRSRPFPADEWSSYDGVLFGLGPLQHDSLFYLVDTAPPCSFFPSAAGFLSSFLTIATGVVVKYGVRDRRYPSNFPFTPICASLLRRIRILLPPPLLSLLPFLTSPLPKRVNLSRPRRAKRPGARCVDDGPLIAPFFPFSP